MQNDTGFKTAVKDITLKIAPNVDVALFSIGLILALVMTVLSSINMSAVGISGSVIATLAAATLVALTQYKSRLGPNQSKVAMLVLGIFLFLGIIMGLVGAASSNAEKPKPKPEDEDKDKDPKTKLQNFLAAENESPSPSPSPSPTTPETKIIPKNTSIVSSLVITALVVIFFFIAALSTGKR
jgi:ABC-type transport system involved in multi-copper enzyme maturation permease subunit